MLLYIFSYEIVLYIVNLYIVNSFFWYDKLFFT